MIPLILHPILLILILPIFENRFKYGKIIIYICEGKSCPEPVETFAEAIKQLEF